MLTSLMKLILNIVFWLAGFISSIILTPIFALVQGIFPDFSDHLPIFMEYLQRILHGVAFAKEVFLNVTGYPRPLFYSIIYFVFLAFSMSVTYRMYKFIRNVYLMIRGSK